MQEISFPCKDECQRDRCQRKHPRCTESTAVGGGRRRFGNSGRTAEFRGRTLDRHDVFIAGLELTAARFANQQVFFKRGGFLFGHRAHRVAFEIVLLDVLPDLHNQDLH
jgi:hypothetical protein